MRSILKWGKNHTRILLIVAVIGIISTSGFVISFTDPLMNYYGVIMRRSELHNYLSITAPEDPAVVEDIDGGLYCTQLASFSFSESFMCFDTQAEIDQFIARRDQINQQLR